MEVAFFIDTPALGDTIAAIPTLRKISEAYGNKQITVFTTKPFLFENHPLVKEALPADGDKSQYKVYRSFSHLVGKQYDMQGQSVEFRHPNIDLRQFHAVSLGFTLLPSEMETDLYIENEYETGFKDYVIIHPTHTWATRTWSQENWQSLVDRLNDSGIPVIAIGKDSSEVGFYNTQKPVMDINIKLGANLLNKQEIGIGELRYMMNKSRAVVTMDSGILHVAGSTDAHIIQLGSSINNKLRAPFRKGTQDYKYDYVSGGCDLFCSSNMKYNVQAHGSIFGVPPQVRCLEDKPTFECQPASNQVYDKLLEVVGKPTHKFEKAFVTHCNEVYAPIVERMLRTVREFSDIPAIAYIINSDYKIDVPGVLTVRLDSDMRTDEDLFVTSESGDNKFIERKSTSIYDIITKKVDATLHALENHADQIVYLDGDSIATHRVDELFDYYEDIEYPKFTTSVEDYMMLDGKGSPFTDTGLNLSLTLESDVCKLLDVNQYNRDYTYSYVQTGYFVAGQRSIPFIKEWLEACQNTIISSDHNKYAPFHEETLANVLLWKYDFRNKMPLIYANANSPERVYDVYNNTEYAGEDTIVRNGFNTTPSQLERVKVFHGEKRPHIVDQMVEVIKEQNSKEQKTRIVFLAPHLSTGGMPEFLLARIKSMINEPELDIHVVEYNMYASTYVVQRDQIQALLPDSNFHEIGYLGVYEPPQRGEELKKIISRLNPDIIHIEESPESFDSFNQLTPEVQSWLYSNDKSWKIVETCHNIWFKPKENKRFFPDAFATVSPEHTTVTFADLPTINKEILFPIITQTNSKGLRKKYLGDFNFDDTADQYHIVNIGLWTPGKNQSELLQWATRLEALYPGRFQVHFVGNQASNFKDYWGPLMKDLTPNIHIHGERNDVDKFYQIADLIVFNSTWECNPLTVRQTLGWDIPIMARNLPQYHNIYKGKIIEITDRLEVNLSRLIEACNNSKEYQTNNTDNMARFKQEHLELYKNMLNKKEPRNVGPKSDWTLSWDNGPKVTSHTTRDLEVDFRIDDKSIYKVTLKGDGHWSRPSLEYFEEWEVVIDGAVYTLDMRGQTVAIQFNSSSLGDTLSWIEGCVAFKEQHEIKKLLIQTHKNWLFDLEYYEDLGVEFIAPSNGIPEGAVGRWQVGVYMEDPGGTVWFEHRNRRDWRKIYLGDICTDALGIKSVRKAPKLAYFGEWKQDKPYICIATASTAQAKYWNNADGWQDLINYYNAKGYDVYHLSKEGSDLKGLKQAPEDLSDVYKLLNGAELFYGISSGLSWFAWATKVPVVLISGFTPEECEDVQDGKTLRIINKDVCNGCWAWEHFNRGDWNWCPTGKGTERHFECTKTITAQSVIEQVESWDVVNK